MEEGSEGSWKENGIGERRRKERKRMRWKKRVRQGAAEGERGGQ